MNHFETVCIMHFARRVDTKFKKKSEACPKLQLYL